MKVELIRPAITFILLAVHHAADAFSRYPSRDDTPPYALKCPADKYVIADPQEVGTRVTWDIKADVVFSDSGSGFHSKWLSPGSGQPGDYYTEDGSPHIVVYSARDRANNVIDNGCSFRIFVSVVHCAYLGAPINGYVTCSYGNRYGSDCNTYCFPGFQLAGSPSSRCERNGEWSGARPVCL
ncbi:Sushi repeat-containing protein SRPX [Holothuria leucospilota]|uniref:Sushi repeat-containing protein SRPX n=1 Tax=Holothuria leucospilota TaxID=206669 RepID=A0A9Q1BKU2_HOLLE|nr:Sushi repeat-containing protein SRPX [Holothuria leucospilota]